VLAAEIQHLLRFLDPADERAAEIAPDMDEVANLL
jgi:hypothetical protein